MSSYRPTFRQNANGDWVVDLDWVEFTRRRMEFIYPGRDHAAAQAADITAWNRLGRAAVAA